MFSKVNRTPEHNNYFPAFLFTWALIFGAFVRLYAPAQTDFPILDGGLFYTMIQDILSNDFRLPHFTSFNQANIPFAYPPMAFYLAAFLSRYLQIELIEIIHWIPAVLSIASIPVFFLLGKSILKDNFLASLATCAYAMLPATFDLYIVGGGLTRSWGMLFALLTIRSVYLMYLQRSIKLLFQTAIFASLLILGHPETTFHTFFIVCLLWFFFGKDMRSFLQSLVIAMIVLVLTSPWWLTVVMRHGISPYLSSLQSGWHHLFFWTPILKMDFAGERFVDIVTVIGMVGFIVQISRKQYLLPIWLLLPFITEPRNPTLFASMALCLLAAVGFQQIAQSITSLTLNHSLENSFAVSRILSSRIGKLWLTFFLIYPLISAFSTSLQLSTYVLTVEQQKAFEWIKANTPKDSRFLILSFEGTFMMPFQEWLPSLTERINIAVEVGYEWLPNRAFEKRRQAFVKLNPCVFESIQCAESWAIEQGLTFDYVIVYQSLITPVDFKVGNEPIRSMHESKHYHLVYQSDLIKIFHQTKP